MIVSAGTRKTGRLAGGAPTSSTYSGDVFGRSKSVYPTPIHGNRPGGLIDKRQQQNPSSTATFGHPFDGGGYRSTATLKKVAPKTTFNTVHQLNPLKQQVPEVPPTSRGTFFRPGKIVPVVKTQFGANKSGKKSNTAFHPQTTVVQPQTKIGSARATEKIVNKATNATKSFHSTGNLWGSGNHSFIKGRPNTISGEIGTGRWQTTKRSVK